MHEMLLQTQYKNMLHKVINYNYSHCLLKVCISFDSLGEDKDDKETAGSEECSPNAYCL